MSTFSPTEGKKERALTEGQQFILDNVFAFNGDAIAAARAFGYSNPYAVVDTLSAELVAVAERSMSRLAPKAVHRTEQILDSDGEVKQASDKLKACQLILDRSNPKTDKMEVSGDGVQPIFILPEKRPLDEPEEV